MAPRRSTRSVGKDPSNGEHDTYISSVDTVTDYLHAKRERITTKIVDAVEIAEEQLIARLDSVSTARKDILDQLQADHNNTVSLTTFQQAPNATTQHSGGFDGKKAEALAIESNTIAKLWEEWELIQQKIVCLGIEVLGPDSPIVSSTLDVKNNRIFKKRVERASALYKMHLRNQKKMVATTQKQESYVTGIGVDVMKQLKSQQKQWKDKKRRQRQEVCNLAKEMLTQI